MKQSLLLIFLLLNTDFAFSQDTLSFLEKKAKLHIASILHENKGHEKEIWEGWYPSIRPYTWSWKGYVEPIYMDSLVCTNALLYSWAKDQLKIL